MKTRITIRQAATMTFLFLATLLNGCKKSGIIPAINNTTQDTSIPAPSRKPESIITTQDGVVILKQEYHYDQHKKLLNYVRYSSVAVRDSFTLFRDSITQTRVGMQNTSSTLTIDSDKTFDELKNSLAGNTMKFLNDGNRLVKIQSQTGGTLKTVASFEYMQGNIQKITSTMGTSPVIHTFSYYDNLPFQEGINEVPILSRGILVHYKLAEQENTTSSRWYNKLVKEINLVFSPDRSLTIHYSYELDDTDRVKAIHVHEVTVNSGVSSSIAYDHAIEYSSL